MAKERLFFERSAPSYVVLGGCVSVLLFFLLYVENRGTSFFNLPPNWKLFGLARAPFCNGKEWRKVIALPFRVFVVGGGGTEVRFGAAFCV